MTLLSGAWHNFFLTLHIVCNACHATNAMKRQLMASFWQSNPFAPQIQVLAAGPQLNDEAVGCWLNTLCLWLLHVDVIKHQNVSRYVSSIQPKSLIIALPDTDLWNSHQFWIYARSHSQLNWELMVCLLACDSILRHFIIHLNFNLQVMEWLPAKQPCSQAAKQPAKQSTSHSGSLQVWHSGIQAALNCSFIILIYSFLSANFTAEPHTNLRPIALWCSLICKIAGQASNFHKLLTLRKWRDTRPATSLPIFISIFISISIVIVPLMMMLLLILLLVLVRCRLLPLMSLVSCLLSL